LALTTLGSAAWTVVLTLMGYFLGTQIPWIKDYLEYIIIAFIVITAIPVVRTFMKEARLRKETAAKEAAAAAALNQERQSAQ
jgi:membrane-associated protein